MAFADLFTFGRARAGQYRDAAGVPQVAGAGVPRFDHTGTGQALGLLVEGRPQFDQADSLAIVQAAWPAGPGTIVHEYQTPAGDIRRRAWYAESPRAAVDSLLNIKGWQRHIGVFDGYLENLGGYILYHGREYALGGVLLAGPDTLLDASASGDPTPMIEG